jgi:[protein-PII] uridylyltransferase
LVVIRPVVTRGCTEVFIYTHDDTNLFVRITALLDQQALDIMDARITTTEDGTALNTFQVLGPDHKPIDQGQESDELRDLLLQTLREPEDSAVRVTRRLPRQHRHFPTETRVSFAEDPRNHRTMMRLTTLDRPGLLPRSARSSKNARSDSKARRSPPSAPTLTMSSSSRPRRPPPSPAKPR